MQLHHPFSPFGIFGTKYNNPFANLSRLLGGLLIGLYADQIGRKTILIFSIVMVGICTTIIGLIPSYQSIGLLSTVLFSLSIAAGITPLVLLYLANHSHGVSYLPANYLIGSCILGFIGLQFLSSNKVTPFEIKTFFATESL
jgi:MFS family permease